MFNGGRSVRAYRPSAASRYEADPLEDDSIERDRQEKILRYIRRAEMGLPLFGEDEQPVVVAPRGRRVSVGS